MGRRGSSVWRAVDLIFLPQKDFDGRDATHE
jgi:hypothetical protein